MRRIWVVLGLFTALSVVGFGLVTWNSPGNTPTLSISASVAEDNCLWTVVINGAGFPANQNVQAKHPGSNFPLLTDCGLKQANYSRSRQARTDNAGNFSMTISTRWYGRGEMEILSPEWQSLLFSVQYGPNVEAQVANNRTVAIKPKSTQGISPGVGIYFALTLFVGLVLAWVEVERWPAVRKTGTEITYQIAKSVFWSVSLPVMTAIVVIASCLFLIGGNAPSGEFVAVIFRRR